MSYKPFKFVVIFHPWRHDPSFAIFLPKQVKRTPDLTQKYRLLDIFAESLNAISDL